MPDWQKWPGRQYGAHAVPSATGFSPAPQSTQPPAMLALRKRPRSHALQRAAPTAAKQPSPGSDDEVPGFTFSFYVPQSDWPMWAVVLRNAAIAALAVCVLVAAHAHLSFKHLDESNFELATCTVLHPTTSIDHLDAHTGNSDKRGANVSRCVKKKRSFFSFFCFCAM